VQGPRRLLLGLGMVATLALPHGTAEAEFGPWHFAVSATGSREFREVYSFRSGRACREQREAMLRGIARVLAEHGGAAVGRYARRLHIGPCRVARRGG
jgi:hypothetical protein